MTEAVSPFWKSSYSGAENACVEVADTAPCWATPSREGDRPAGYPRGSDVFVIGSACFAPATYMSLGAVRSVNVSS
ncbi:DUF397 domain-containing protein [Streptomyces galilaeus]